MPRNNVGVPLVHSTLHGTAFSHPRLSFGPHEKAVSDGWKKVRFRVKNSAALKHKKPGHVEGHLTNVDGENAGKSVEAKIRERKPEIHSKLYAAMFG